MRNKMIKINELKNTNNSCIFIRHGEKDINNYCLTNRGKSEIIEFGNSLCMLNKKITIYSSPEDRCVETATIINNIVNGDNNICISNVLGKPGIQVKDEFEYTKLTDIMRCRDIFKEWKKGMHGKAMNRPEIIRTKIIDYFERTSLLNGITLYISQSGTVACTGYSLGLIDYKANDEDWVDYLDGYILRL